MKKKLSLVIAIVGVIVVITYLTYFFVKPFGFFNFMLGFGLIYLLFVLPVKWLGKK